MRKQGAKMVASVFLNQWICQHGMLKMWYSYQGCNFDSQHLATRKTMVKAFTKAALDGALLRTGLRSVHRRAGCS